MTSTPPPRSPRSGQGRKRRAVVIPRRKPMQRARRVSLFEREVKVRLSKAAVEILFGHASVLSEGQLGPDSYFGSTMITMDMSRAGVQVSEACDVATARNVEALLRTDGRVYRRALMLGTREAERLAGKPLAPPQADLHVHRSGQHFYLDLDLEAAPAGSMSATLKAAPKPASGGAAQTRMKDGPQTAAKDSRPVSLSVIPNAVPEQTP